MLSRVAAEMAPRAVNISGIQPLMAAIRA